MRLLHWTLVATLIGAGLTTKWWVGAHQPLGWVAASAVGLRLVWGFVSPKPASRYARLAQFVRSPRAVLAYLGEWRRHREPRYIGHNPLGGWMVLALLVWVLGLGLSGWLYTTDWFWGDATVERIHELLAWSLPVLVALHLIGVRSAGKRHRENLVRSMIDGRKRLPQGHDIS